MLKGQDNAVKALTNFHRCWETPASNHPEETAGQLEKMEERNGEKTKSSL